MAMLVMVVVGLPMYICATASTPIAAVLILKGVSPGAALVFLLVGPATNMASLSVLTGLLGKRAVLIYLASIAGVSVLAGLLLDKIYAVAGISAQAAVGQAAEIIPVPVQYLAAAVLIAISIKPLISSVKGLAEKVAPQKSREASVGCACAGSGDSSPDLSVGK